MRLLNHSSWIVASQHGVINSNLPEQFKCCEQGCFCSPLLYWYNECHWLHFLSISINLPVVFSFFLSFYVQFYASQQNSSIGICTDQIKFVLSLGSSTTLWIVTLCLKETRPVFFRNKSSQWTFNACTTSISPAVSHWSAGRKLKGDSARNISTTAATHTLITSSGDLRHHSL